MAASPRQAEGLLHLVKLKGDVFAAYLRSPELTALVRRGIASELIPPAKCLVDYVSPDDAARYNLACALGTNAKIESESFQRRDGLGRGCTRLRLRAQEGRGVRFAFVQRLWSWLQICARN
jgi:hypothetical protein